MSEEPDAIKSAPTIRLSSEQARAFQPKAADAAKVTRMESDAILASTAPLPGSLRDAFAAEPRTFFDMTLQPISATHIAALVKAKNPFIDALRYGMAAAQVADPAEKTRLSAEAEKLNVQGEDLFQVLHIFSLTPDEVRSEVGRCCRDAADSAVIKMMDSFPPILPDQLSAVLADHYFESFKTALNFQAVESPDDRAKKNGEAGPATSTSTASAPSLTPSQP